MTRSDVERIVEQILRDLELRYHDETGTLQLMWGSRLISTVVLETH
jgi:hypothetical protein